MQDIKFRAYVKHLKILIEVQRINFDCKTVEGYIVHPDEGEISVFCFEDVYISEYTGLKDKNGKGIWEGDVALIFGITAEVRYSDTWCGWVFFCRQKPKELQELPFYDGTKGNYTECEIIGNIYDLGNQSK